MDQLKASKEIYSTADISSVFHANEAFILEIGDDLPYISLDNVLEKRFIIRLLPENSLTLRRVPY